MMKSTNPAILILLAIVVCCFLSFPFCKEKYNYLENEIFLPKTDPFMVYKPHRSLSSAVRNAL